MTGKSSFPETPAVPIKAADERERGRRAGGVTGFHRIGFYIEFNQSFTGGPRAAFNLVSRLDRARFVPTVITNRQSELTEELRRLGVDPIVVPQPPRIGIDDGLALRGGGLHRLQAALDVLRYNLRIMRILRDLQVDCLWVRNVKGVLLTGMAAKLLGIPVIWDIGLELPSRGVIRHVHNLAFRLCTRMVVEGGSVSRSIFDARQLERYGRKLMVIPSGIPDDRARAFRERPARAWRKGEPFVILNVASVNPRKNQLMLLQAFAAVAERHSHAEVWIAGAVTDQRYGVEVERFIRERGMSERVSLLGWRDDLAALLSRAHVFVLTSRFEGVPYSVLEAMHAGLPVLATAAGGVPDVVEDGRTGYVVPIDDVAAMADRLGACLRNPEHLATMAAAARRVVDDIYTATRWADRYQAELDRIVASGSLVDGKN